MPVETNEETEELGSATKGKEAELIVLGKLLERGFKVYSPMVDTGVDCLVPPNGPDQETPHTVVDANGWYLRYTFTDAPFKPFSYLDNGPAANPRGPAAGYGICLDVPAPANLNNCMSRSITTNFKTYLAEDVQATTPAFLDPPMNMVPNPEACLTPPCVIVHEGFSWGYTITRLRCERPSKSPY